MHARRIVYNTELCILRGLFIKGLLNYAYLEDYLRYQTILRVLFMILNYAYL